MAQLLSPVCTDTIKFQNPLQSFSPRNKYPILGRNSVNWSSHGGKRKGLGRMRVTSQESASYEDMADDYYAVLGLLPDATPEQIKKAYYSCMKSCHPDLSGDDPETTNFCMFINEVYAVLSDPVQRMVYDEIQGYALTAINPFYDDSSPKDHVFVDEFSCIGCKNCANVCSDVFSIEEDFGRARAYSQTGNPDTVQQAVDSCDDAHQVALMLSGMGSASVDVFRMDQARIRMVKQKDSDKTQTYWNNLWGKAKDYENTEEQVKERAARAAAASRRWREYSRRGVDKPPTFKLPEAISNKEP
ncbi:hypothetical protein DH2020_031873 [Rehmannia glutinosa]|uniref:Uncharacterized protein n=1 Tax=Rehmannia glutinosa TaxID=99300 RepID=A0ABR0VJU5_REHGL